MLSFFSCSLVHNVGPVYDGRVLCVAALLGFRGLVISSYLVLEVPALS